MSTTKTAKTNAGLTHSADSSGDADSGNAQSYVASTALGHDGLQLSHKLLGLGGGLVHFPVTGNDGLTVLSVHFIFLQYISASHGDVIFKVTGLRFW